VPHIAPSKNLPHILQGYTRASASSSELEARIAEVLPECGPLGKRGDEAISFYLSQSSPNAAFSNSPVDFATRLQQIYDRQTNSLRRTITDRELSELWEEIDQIDTLDQLVLLEHLCNCEVPAQFQHQYEISKKRLFFQSSSRELYNYWVTSRLVSKSRKSDNK
jgi:hypothetical protein